MKKAIVLISFLIFSSMAHSTETLGEKVDAKANDVKRSIKKAANRAKEEVCQKNDAECLAEKAKHRGEEVNDYSKDKVKEIGNEVDNDNK